MTKRKKRKKHLSILIIPDDYTDPLTFKISSGMVRTLFVILSVLVIHILTGAIFYYKFSVTNRYSKQLEKENINLKEDNRRINQLYDTVEDFIQFNSRLRNALGVDQGFEISDRKKSQVMNTFRRNINMIPDNEVNAEDVPPQTTPLSKGKLNFITRTKSTYHQFANNIPTCFI